MSTWLAVVGAAIAVALLVPAPTRVSSTRPTPRIAPDDPGWMMRRRPVLAVLGALGATLFLGGTPGLLGGGVTGVVVWVVVGRAESPATRHEREALRRDLPHVVTLFAAALRAGVTPTEAARLVSRALPGAASRRLDLAASRLALGADPGQVWVQLSHDPGLAPLGRALARSHETGASVVAAVDRLSVDLARKARGEVEDRARAVGVKAAVPLGLCLLPAFVLIGIVPLVAGLLSTLTW